MRSLQWGLSCFLETQESACQLAWPKVVWDPTDPKTGPVQVLDEMTF